MNCKICNLPLDTHTLTQLRNCRSLDKVQTRIRIGGITQAIERELLKQQLTTTTTKKG